MSLAWINIPHTRWKWADYGIESHSHHFMYHSAYTIHIVLQCIDTIQYTLYRHQAAEWVEYTRAPLGRSARVCTCVCDRERMHCVDTRGTRTSTHTQIHTSIQGPSTKDSVWMGKVHLLLRTNTIARERYVFELPAVNIRCSNYARARKIKIRTTTMRTTTATAINEINCWPEILLYV